MNLDEANYIDVWGRRLAQAMGLGGDFVRKRGWVGLEEAITTMRDRYEALQDEAQDLRAKQS